MSNSDNNESMKGPIYSAIVGAIFFAIPYLGLDFPFFLSMIVGGVAFYASSLILSDTSKKKSELEAFAQKVAEQNATGVQKDIIIAKKQNLQIYSMIDKVEDPVLKENIRQVYITASKIISAVEKNNVKIDKVQTFFNYYLPATLKILERYDEIENQQIDSAEARKFMNSTEAMLIKINKSFQAQLNSLYQTEMIDTDAEMKVFEQMLNQEGINGDFNNLKK